MNRLKESLKVLHETKILPYYNKKIQQAHFIRLYPAWSTVSMSRRVFFPLTRSFSSESIFVPSRSAMQFFFLPVHGYENSCLIQKKLFLTKTLLKLDISNILFIIIFFNMCLYFLRLILGWAVFLGGLSGKCINVTCSVFIKYFEL